MKKAVILIIVLFLFSTTAFTQNNSKSDSNIDSFVPKNWKIVTLTKGNLNNDNLEDIAMVIQDSIPENFVKNDFLGAPVLNINPRHLLILFKNNDSKSYRLGLINKKFIPSENDSDNSCLADPLLEDGGITIKKGIVIIDLHYWLSCGSYEVTHNTYKFRFQNNRFELIGYDSSSMSRSSGEENRDSYNFMTHKKCTTSGSNLFEDTMDKPTTKCKNFKSDKRLVLENMTINTEINY